MSKSRRVTARLCVEALEARDVPAVFYPTTAADLVAAVSAANASPEADTISLTAGATYRLAAVNNTTFGASGLPVVAAGGGPLTVEGNGSVIERSTGRRVPAFRLITVEAGVTAVPVSAFYDGAAPGTFIRFCFSKRDAVLDGALDRLARWVERRGAGA